MAMLHLLCYRLLSVRLSEKAFIGATTLIQMPKSFRGGSAQSLVAPWAFQ